MRKETAMNLNKTITMLQDKAPFTIVAKHPDHPKKCEAHYYNKANADFALARFKKNGYKATLTTK